MEVSRSGLRAPYIAKSKSSEMLFPAFFMEYILEKKEHSDVLWIVFQATDLRFFVLATKTNQPTKKHLKNKGKI